MLPVIAATALALAGCTADAEPPLSTPRDGVTMSFMQLRSDVAARQAQVRIHNGSSGAIMIAGVAVTDPRFAGPATRVSGGHATTIEGGKTVDLRIQLPEMNCTVAGGEMSVTLTLPGSDGSVDVRYPLPDPLDVIGPLHARECLAKKVADAATLTLSSFTPSPAGAPAQLALSIEPTGDASATIVGVHSTNLLTFEAGPAGTLPIGVEVTPDSADSVVDVPIVPLRCDPHAVLEDKRGTVFTLDVETDGESGTIVLPASDEMRGRMLAWVADWCGFGG